MKSSLSTFCLVTTLAIGLPSLSVAEEVRFLRTQERVHQANDGTVQIINVDEQGPLAGIFLRVGPPMDIQSFTPAEIDPETSETLFIKYAPETNRYTEIVTSKSLTRIVGSFSAQIGSVRLAVDNVNPYVSIVSGNAVLGFLGTGVIVNNDKATLLEANQFSNYRGIIKPYVLKKGELYLNNKVVTGDTIGLTLEQPKNSCLPGGNAVYLRGADLSKIKRTSDKSERLALLERSLKNRKEWDPFKRGVLIIQVNADPGAVVLINYEQGSVQQISKLATSSSSKKVCVVEDLPLR